MMDREERRAPGIRRVPVERVVEICGRDERVPAFEAESVEVSGRGMHVRTPYLPELGAPLVCRLEEHGREIVVEGTVAWRSQTDGGGEFGIKFTALDSGSVETLKELCGMISPSSAARDPDETDNTHADAAASIAPSGAPVKLHIDGLGAPMKARVRRDSGKRVHVGSNLEFLKVGRSLEIEDLELRQRKGARIDSVSIAIDPQSQVPQLVVALRYDGIDEADITPEPSVLGAMEAEAEDKSEPAPEIEERISTMSAASSDDVDEELDADDEIDDDVDFHENAWRGRLERLAARASKVAQSTGSKALRLGVGATGGVGALMRQAGTKVRELNARRAASGGKRRTSPAVAVSPSGPNRRLRPQSGRYEEAAPTSALTAKKKIAAAGAAIVVFGAIGAYALHGGDHTPALPKPAATAPISAATTTAVAAAAPVANTPVANTVKPAPAKNGGSVVADVPLFGPTAMATMEPAPLDPPSGDMTQEPEGSDQDEPSAPDEAFHDPPAVKVQEASEPPQASEQMVEPWGTGKLHLPVVHRIKLDGAAGALEGIKKSNGFSVFLPKRKLLESGKTIARRDDRILEVRTSNEAGGARVTFVFQGKVPGYKVRLKKNYVEFFISSADKN